MGDTLRQLDGAMIGRSVAVAGHFGELMQGRIGTNGPLALISLPCQKLVLQASALPARSFRVYSRHGAQIISPARARAFLAKLGLRMTAAIVVSPQMPVGAGAGASTATLVALAQLAGWRGDALQLARACVACEGASDPLMLPHPAQTLWASREARILMPLPALPSFDILGGFWGRPQRTNPHDFHFPDISSLLPAWIDAAKAQDLAALAELSTTSAKATLAMRHAAEDPIFALADQLGALGIVIAHTGSARGLIFAPNTVPSHGVENLRAAGLSQVLTFRYKGA